MWRRAMMASSLSNLLLLCALISGVRADDNDVRRLSSHRTRPHDEGQPQGVITKDDYGNLVEVAAVSQHQEQAASPQTPLPFRPQQTKIVGGDVVDGGNGGYPFQVQLGSSGFCGGQLISPDVVLTAAHCVDNKSPTSVQIWNGSQMQPRTVQSRVRHPSYNSNRFYNDLALIKLTEPALAVKEVNGGGGTYWELVDDYEWGDHPPMIRLQRYQSPSGCTSLYAQGFAEDILKLTVIGHGTTSSGGKMPGKLLEADVHYVRNSVCQEQYRWEDISDDMLCAADTLEGEDACQGDSGGPLFTRLPAGDGEHNLYTLVGTTSWGYGCAEKEYPGVYSRVAANTEWIDGKVCGDLSPKSCTVDGKIRDYALESLTGGTSVSRRTKKNVVTNNARAALYGEKLKEELCELLGGSVDEETIPPASSSPTTTSSPSQAPIITPSMAPSVSPSLMPSTFPTDSPTLPPGKSPTKKFVTKVKNGNKKAKGIMFQMKAEAGDVILERISFKTKDDKATNVQVYFQLGSYETFAGKGMNANAWGSPVFNGVPYMASSGFREAVLDDVLTIPKGGMASIYLSGQKEFLFEEGDQEFAVADTAGGDFEIFTGAAMKKPFEQRLSNANFVGGMTYYTYTVATKVTSTPSLSPSSSELPTLPPNEDTSSPSMLPSLSPSVDGDGGSGGSDGDGTPKEYTTPDVNKADANAKGVMFSITAKAKEVSITGLGILGKDAKESDLWIYYQVGSYNDFDALDVDEWIEVFKDKVMLDPDELVDIELTDAITIPAGGTVSVYVLSKKSVCYTKSSDAEFDMYAQSEDFMLRVGTSTKKEFQQPEKLAEFAGRIMYQT